MTTAPSLPLPSFGGGRGRLESTMPKYHITTEAKSTDWHYVYYTIVADNIDEARKAVATTSCDDSKAIDFGEFFDEHVIKILDENDNVLFDADHADPPPADGSA